jgi:hypothetical protein
MNKIQFQISRQDTIGQVQEKFSGLFPFLWIKIFKQVGGFDQYKTQNIMLCPEVKMSDMSPNFHDGTLIISGNMTVAVLEEYFYDIFGLVVQVYGKDGSPVMESSVIHDFLFKHVNQPEYAGFPVFGKAAYFRQIPFGC